MTDTFTWIPLVEPQGAVTLRVRKAQFGDGYKQTVADGINTKVQSWPFSWIGTDAAMGALMAFLDAHTGKSFLFTPPGVGAVPLYWTCEAYTHVPMGGGVTRVAATFDQDFKP
jgi:phage-related protein